MEDPLREVAELAGMIAGSAPPTVLDVRWRLGGPSGAADHAAGHLPGAVFLDLDRDLSGPSGSGGRHPLPDPEALAAVLRAAGVSASRPVVVYDGGTGGADGVPVGLPAARTWWTLRWAGHPRVWVLAGGWPAWVAAGQPVTTDAPAPPAGDFVVRPGGMPVLDAAGAAALAGGGGVLLDVRAGERYRGETEPLDPVAGHIPGAVNAPATDPRWRAPAEWLAQLGAGEATPVGAYCGSGVTAAAAVLALHRAGRPDAALYVGSWSDWVADPDRPVATGATP